MANLTVDEPRGRRATPASRRRHLTNGARPDGNGTAKNGAATASRHGAKATAEDLDQRKLLDILLAMRKGRFSSRLRVKWGGDAGRIAETVNELMDVHERFAHELERLAKFVGTEGRTSHRAAVNDLSGSWSD